MNKNQQGQALLFVVVVMTVALAIGIGVSVQTINSLQRTSQTDTSVRVVSAAEAGIERFLVVGDGALEQIAADPSGYCDSVDGATYDGTLAQGGCVISITTPGLVGADTDNITSQAVVSVEEFSSNLPSVTTNGHYGFDLTAGEVKEVNLFGYIDSNIDVCWTGAADIYYIVYDQDGIEVKGGLKTDTVAYTQGGFTFAGGGLYGYSYCSRVTLGDSDNYGLRLRSIGGDAQVGVLGVADDLPIQGYKITSTGILAQNSETVSTKQLVVYKSLPYLPGVFDYGVYANSIGY